MPSKLKSFSEIYWTGNSYGVWKFARDKQNVSA